MGLISSFLKVKNFGSLSSTKNDVLATRSTQDLAHLSGIDGDQIPEPVPYHAKAGCEKVIAGQNNTFIVMGRDRPGATFSGYGGLGHMECGTIDITAGRGSFLATEKTSDGKKIELNPNATYDASKIYISQKTDIDKNFNLATGKVGNSKAKAGIAIKSDAVRIIAREGVKIVTGTDRRNSRGGKKASVSGIDLIAGNDATNLQPIPKGDNLVRSLKEITDLIKKLNGIVDSFITYQIDFNAEITNHTHYDPVNVVLGLAADDEGGPNDFFDGKNFPSIPVQVSGTKNIISLTAISKKDLLTHKLNLERLEKAFFEPIGKSYICSRYNNTN